MPEVIMPKMGDSMEVGKLLSWRKQSGDQIKSGDVIAEIETDKSNVEVEAEDDGVLQTIAKAGEEVPVGGVIATIGSVASKEAPVSPPTPAAQPEKARLTAKLLSSEPRDPSSMPQPRNGQTSQTTKERLKASPLARKVARARNIDIAAVAGTGPNGRIIEADVIALATKPMEAAPNQAAAPVAAPAGAGTETRELSQMRRVIAKRMIESKTTIPHFYITLEVDMEEALALREKLNSYDESLQKISLNDMVVKACGKALRKFPDVNSTYLNGKMITSKGAHVGVAVALEDGLIVPVVRDAGTLPLRQVASTAKDLIGKARQKKLQPADYTGGSFTVSNLGSFDVENFIAIIDPAQGAILAVSTIVKKAVVVSDAIVIRPRMNITLSGDHRVIDGATGAKFAQEVKRLLQNPLGLLE